QLRRVDAGPVVTRIDRASIRGQQLETPVVALGERALDHQCLVSIDQVGRAGVDGVYEAMGPAAVEPRAPLGIPWVGGMEVRECVQLIATALREEGVSPIYVRDVLHEVGDHAKSISDVAFVRG